MTLNKLNALDFKNWKKYINDVTTNSRWLSNLNNKVIYGHWLIPKRDYLPQIPKDLKSFHGIWISEIPYQMILRFTRVNDLIWSVFSGTGIDNDIAIFLNRKCISTDINPKRKFIINADARFYKNNKHFKMALLHPPYWDMIKFNEHDSRDGSSKKTLDEFLFWWNEIADNVSEHILDNGYIILACGNLYKNKEEIELGEILKNMILKKGFILKQHIIKDYGETKGSTLRQYNLNYYRQLKNGYGNFYGDNIYILKKQKSKNSITDLIKKYI